MHISWLEEPPWQDRSLIGARALDLGSACKWRAEDSFAVDRRWKGLTSPKKPPKEKNTAVSPRQSLTGCLRLKQNSTAFRQNNQDSKNEGPSSPVQFSVFNRFWGRASSPHTLLYSCGDRRASKGPADHHAVRVLQEKAEDLVRSRRHPEASAFPETKMQCPASENRINGMESASMSERCWVFRTGDDKHRQDFALCNHMRRCPNKIMPVQDAIQPCHVARYERELQSLDVFGSSSPFTGRTQHCRVSYS